jgi:hypothetical protein
VDACWDQNLTSNTTWSVHPPGNQRGTVVFSMNAINNTGAWRRGGRGGGSGGGDGAHLVVCLVAVVIAVVDVASGLWQLVRSEVLIADSDIFFCGQPWVRVVGVVTLSRRGRPAQLRFACCTTVKLHTVAFVQIVCVSPSFI